MVWFSTILETVIIPVIKNKSGDATDKHNYRPIAISTTMSKVLELLMLHKMYYYLYNTLLIINLVLNSVYSEKHDIVYNVKKSVCIVIRP